MSAELVQLVRDQIGPVAALRRVDVVPALPKTRSGKILRKTMRGIADGRDELVPSTIENAADLDALRPVLTPPAPPPPQVPILTLSIADHTVLVHSAPGNLAPIQVGCHGQVCELGNGQSLEFTL